MKLAALALLATLALFSNWHYAYAGHTKCDPEEGAPCGMKTCAHMAKKQMWCSTKCHKTCCSCVASCNGHQHDQAPSSEDDF